MRFWTRKQDDALGWIIPLISVMAGIELLYAARSGVWKSNAVFPAIPIGIRLTVTELVIASFIVFIGGFYVSKRIFETGRVRLAPPGYKRLTVAYIFTLLIAVGIGVLLRAPDLFTEARVFLIPGSLFFIFLNLPINSQLEEWVIRWFYRVGITSFIFGLLMHASPAVESVITYPIEYWMALYAGTFAWCVAIARLLWRGFAWEATGVLLLGIAVIFVFLTHKPIVFTMLVTMGVLVLVAMRSGKKSVKKRAWRVALSTPALIISTLLVLPQAIFNQLVGIFARRYLKIWAVSSAQDLQNSLSKIGQRQDLSAGRFDIWQSYFSESLGGFGLPPDGFGGIPIVYTSLHGWREAFPAHNTVAYIAYHGGLIAAVLYVIIIARFLPDGFNRVHRIDISDDFLNRPEIVGVFAFIVGIIAVSLVGGPLLDYRLSWFFWFLTAVLVKRWNYVLGR